MPTRPQTYRPAGQPDPKEKRRESDRNRARKEWKKWYDSARFRKSRALFLTRNPKCVDCNKLFEITQLDLDHEVPHRGDYDLFWDVNNWRSRCHRCHSRKTGKGF